MPRSTGRKKRFESRARARHAAAPSPSPAASHRAAGPSSVAIRVVTVSDTRTLADDKSGALLEEIFTGAGHTVSRAVVRDDRHEIGAAITDAETDASIRAIVLTGGTGISSRDVTAEVVGSMLDKELPGFGEIFRALSYEEIGSAAFLSRAVAGIRGKRFLAALPGSSAAVRLAATKLLLPEIPHLVRELDKAS